MRALRRLLGDRPLSAKTPELHKAATHEAVTRAAQGQTQAARFNQQKFDMDAVGGSGEPEDAETSPVLWMYTCVKREPLHLSGGEGAVQAAVNGAETLR
jgi:hypothetical protein